MEVLIEFWFDIKHTYTYNQFQNIVRIFDVLSIFFFTTSETMDDYYL